jgi:hypothetical protein
MKTLSKKVKTTAVAPKGAGSGMGGMALMMGAPMIGGMAEQAVGGRAGKAISGGLTGGVMGGVMGSMLAGIKKDRKSINFLQKTPKSFTLQMNN